LDIWVEEWGEEWVEIAAGKWSDKSLGGVVAGADSGCGILVLPILDDRMDNDVATALAVSLALDTARLLELAIWDSIVAGEKSEVSMLENIFIIRGVCNRLRIASLNGERLFGVVRMSDSSSDSCPWSSSISLKLSTDTPWSFIYNRIARYFFLFTSIPFFPFLHILFLFKNMARALNFLTSVNCRIALRLAVMSLYI
jgi:hypothetical protein